MKETLKPGITYEHRFVVPSSQTVPMLYPESESTKRNSMQGLGKRSAMHNKAYIPHPFGTGAVIFSAILSVARVLREAAWRYL